MKRILLLSLCLLCASFLFSQSIMKVSEIKVGMEGTGKTIFKGTRVEEFKFRVLGILENVLAPGKHAIWVELISPDLEEAGVIEGMSGSPLYIDGKIIGAVAFGFTFAKKPIAGITPIEDIIKTNEYNSPTVMIDISRMQIKMDKEAVEKIAGLITSELERRTHFSTLKEMTPIRLIPSGRGLSPSALSLLKPVLGQSAIAASTSKTLAGEALPRDLFKISAADAVAVPLIRGDFEFSFSGTVTYIDGKTAYLFGHPLLNLGNVDFPLHKAEIITVFPSYNSSFRLTATKNMIGAVVQDRFSAVQAELGRSPYMIPLKVFLKDRNRTFNIEMVNHPLLTPMLTFISLASIFSAEYLDGGFQSLDVKGKIFIENEKNVIIDDLFSGETPVDDFTGLMLAVNFFLMNNPEKSIKIQKIDFEISSIEAMRRAEIENVVLNKSTFEPGDAVNITVYLKNERGGRVVEEVAFAAPNLGPGANFYLLVADKEEIGKFDARNIKTNYFPTSLNLLINAINNLRKNNRIYFKLLTETQGLFIKGHEYANLPLGLQNMFLFNTATKEQSKVKYSTISEYQLEIPAMVVGSKLFKLKIKER